MKIKISNLFSFLLMASMFLFLGGCRKDEGINKTDNGKELMQNKDFYKPLSHYPDLERFLERKYRSLTLRNAYFVYDDLDTTKVFESIFSNGYTSYAMTIKNHKNDHWTYNLVIEKVDNNFENIMIVGIEHLTANSLIIHQIEFEEGFGLGNRNSELESCIREYIESGSTLTNCKPNDPPGSTGGGGNGGNGGYSGDGNGGNNGGIPWYDPINFWQPSPGNSGGGPGPSVTVKPSPSGTGNPKGITDDWFWDVYIFEGESFIIKRYRKPIRGITLKDEDKGSRDVSSGCVRKLKYFGLIDSECKPLKDLGDELYKECQASNPKLTEKIESLEKSIINPCTGATFDVSKLGKILCLEDKFSDEEFDKALDEALEGLDIIIYNSSQFAACPKLQCVVDNIMNGNLKSGLTTNFCNKFNTPNKPIIAIKYQSFKTDPTLNPNALANASTFVYNNGNVDHTMIFNSDVCNNNSNPLDFYDTFSHESIHNLINAELVTSYGWDGKLATRNAAFLNMMKLKYPGNTATNDHELMLTHYLNDLIANLKAVNGNLSGTASNGKDIYLGLILFGFGGDLPFIQNHFGLTATDISTMHQEYINWQKVNQSPNGIFSICP